MSSVGSLPDLVILAGGLGTRLRPVVGDLPKVMAPVGGRPFLQYLLEHARRCGARRVILAVGYKAESIERRFGDRYAGTVALVYSREVSPAGTGGALSLAHQHVTTPDVIVLNGDSFVPVDLANLAVQHRHNGGVVTIVTVPVADGSAYGAVMARSDGRILGFAEKAGAGATTINAGVYMMTSRLLAEIPVPSSLERDVLPRLVGDGMFAMGTDAPFIDIGTPESYARLQAAAGALLGSATP